MDMNMAYYGCPMMQPDMMMPNMMQPGMMQPDMEMEEEGKEQEQDMEYMKKMYPELCQKIQFYVDQECDKMDYDGSEMHDDYPDKETLEQMIDRIYKEAVEDMPELEEEEMKRQRYPRRRLLRSLVGSVLFNEIFGIRRPRRRRRRPYYPSPYYQNPYYQSPYYQNPYYQSPYYPYAPYY